MRLRSAVQHLFGLTALALFLAGCGGGTTGTGGIRPTGIEGKLLSLTGSPVPGATITVNQTGDSGITDALGQFALEAALASGSALTLSVDTADTTALVEAGVIPEDVEVVELTLQINETQGTVTIISSNISPTPVPTNSGSAPKPTSTSSGKAKTPKATSTAAPAATPTVVSEDPPAPTPSPTATPVPQPTAAAAAYLYTGRLSYRSDGTAISGARIAISGVEFVDTTDSLGRFRSDAPATFGGDKVITVTFNGSSAQTSIQDIPEGGGHVIIFINITTTSGPPRNPLTFTTSVESVTFEGLQQP